MYASFQVDSVKPFFCYYVAMRTRTSFYFSPKMNGICKKDQPYLRFQIALKTYHVHSLLKKS